jgi:F0F1-type ATP synthase assembly protein I
MAENPWSGVGDAWAITSTLIAGMVAWGGAGYLLDRWLDFRGLFLPIGMVIGMAGGIYLVYIRYVRDDRET